MGDIAWRYILRLKNAYPSVFENALKSVATAKAYKFNNPHVWLASDSIGKGPFKK